MNPDNTPEKMLKREFGIVFPDANFKEVVHLLSDPLLEDRVTYLKICLRQLPHVIETGQWEVFDDWFAQVNRVTTQRLLAKGYNDGSITVATHIGLTLTPPGCGRLTP